MGVDGIAPAGSGYPPLGAALWALGAIVKVLGPLAVSKPDCGSVPNLEKVQDSVLDGLAGTPATITETASGDCDEHPDTGWRIKDPTQTFTFQPFLPAIRTPYGSTRAAGREVGTITFDAADCAVAIGGTFDLVASAATAGVPKANASTWAQMFTTNVMLLEIKNANTLHGAIEMPAESGSPAMSLLFTVTAW